MNCPFQKASDSFVHIQSFGSTLNRLRAEPIKPLNIQTGFMRQGRKSQVTVQVGLYLLLSPLSSFLAAEEEAGRFHSNGSCEAFTVCVFSL